jgi:NAD+ kinase
MSGSRGGTRIFLVGNPQKPNVTAAFAHLKAWLQAKHLLVGADLDGRPELIAPAKPDLVISLGGDGTILCVAQAMQHSQVPIVGVNMGKLGYLADFTAAELESDLDRIISDRELISHRMMLDVTIHGQGGQDRTGIALNDCVIRVGEPFRTIGVGVSIDNLPVTTILGDGLIIATPTGSTAHNMSCGGPIVQPDVDAIVLTPLCPHSLTHRPVVVGPECKIDITLQRTGGGCAAILDGQAIHPLSIGSTLTLQKSKQTFQLVRNPRRKAWDLLVQKLKWGVPLT